MDLKGELIGTLRHRVAILQPVYSVTDFGNSDVTSWSTLGTFWGLIDLAIVSSREEEQAGKLASKTAAQCRLRYNSAITTKMRAKNGSTEYAILAVIHDPHKRYTLLDLEADGNSYGS